MLNMFTRYSYALSWCTLSLSFVSQIWAYLRTTSSTKNIAKSMSETQKNDIHPQGFFFVCLDARTMLRTNSLLPSATQYANCLLQLPLSNPESLPLLAMDEQWAEHRSIATLSVHNEELATTPNAFFRLVAKTMSTNFVRHQSQLHDSHPAVIEVIITSAHGTGIKDRVQCPIIKCSYFTITLRPFKSPRLQRTASESWSSQWNFQEKALRTWWEMVADTKSRQDMNE